MDELIHLLEDELDVPLIALGPWGENFVQTYQTRWGIVQFHLGGTGLPPFEEAETRAVSRVTELGTPVHCLDTRSLLESKRKANRPQDQADIQFLEAKLQTDGST